ncbi:MAG: hypothetical protein KBF21_21495 [Thermoanaerobaculia bacterium]|jgi:hypothetical protein|nr:hypothetical protein [Thermoanaerobaculia bacterium]MBP9826816.1 hypothetical protein [Thermoanaerobaculia bacterium]
MFLGHYAVGLAAKRATPALSLGLLFGAAQLADLLWPNLLLAGVEKLEIVPGATAVNPLRFVSYPWSHSLVALGAWGVLLATLAVLLRRGRGRDAAIVVGVVVSHWVLDVVSHLPDMPLTITGETRLGLGLWRSLPWTLAVELLLLGAGAAVYLRSTRARDRVGSIGLGALLALLVAIYAGSLFGPLPPSPEAVAWSAQALWLLVLFGWWVDRHRVPAGPAAGGPANGLRAP